VRDFRLSPRCSRCLHIARVLKLRRLVLSCVLQLTERPCPREMRTDGYHCDSELLPLEQGPWCTEETSLLLAFPQQLVECAFGYPARNWMTIIRKLMGRLLTARSGQINRSKSVRWCEFGFPLMWQSNCWFFYLFHIPKHIKHRKSSAQEVRCTVNFSKPSGDCVYHTYRNVKSPELCVHGACMCVCVCVCM